MLLLALLVGCPPQQAPVEGTPELVTSTPVQGNDADAAATDRDAQDGEPVEPGFWKHDSLPIALGIPKGWDGHTGPHGSSLLLVLHHSETDVGVELWAFERSGTKASPRPRPGCEMLFSDQGSHRSVPLFGHATTATCVPADVAEPTIQGWYGIVGDRELHFEVMYPPGTMVVGRQLVQPLLQSLETL